MINKETTAMQDEAFQEYLKKIETFRKKVLFANERNVESTNEVPEAIVEEMKQMGLFGLSIPEEYGGLGLDLSRIVEILFVFGQTLPAFQAIWGMNIGIGSKALLTYGTDAQKAKYLPAIASGELIASFCLTEENAGSDAYNVQTSATRNGSGWVLNGKKRYITNAPEAGLYSVVARTQPGELSMFLVERTNPGVSVGAYDRKMGHRGSHTAEVVLSDCRVDEQALIGSVGDGAKFIGNTLVFGRMHISSIAVGMAERLLNESIAHARDRVQFKKSLSHFQLIQDMLAVCATEIYAAKAMIQKTAREFARGNILKKESSMCKFFATEMANRVADAAVQIHGGQGYMAGNIVETFYRDARLLKIYEGTNQIQKLIVARQLFD